MDHSLALTCHPATASASVATVDVRLTPRSGALLALSYAIRGRIGALRVPAPGAARFAEGLWQATCCEAFVRGDGAAAYCEFNFSPSRAWAAYRFSGYREGMTPLQDPALDPAIEVRAGSAQLVLEALIRLDRGGLLQARAALSIALCAVIEEQGGGFSYWALAHPPGKPDFHSPLGFALELRRAGAGVVAPWSRADAG